MRIPCKISPTIPVKAIMDKDANNGNKISQNHGILVLMAAEGVSCSELEFVFDIKL